MEGVNIRNNEAASTHRQLHLADHWTASRIMILPRAEIGNSLIGDFVPAARESRLLLHE
jgi:hypothetical protein